LLATIEEVVDIGYWGEVADGASIFDNRAGLVIDLLVEVGVEGKLLFSVDGAGGGILPLVVVVDGGRLSLRQHAIKVRSVRFHCLSHHAQLQFLDIRLHPLQFLVLLLIYSR
jgi:hypothetical protein